MEQTVCTFLVEEFKREISSIFKDNLAFAFIFGSVARGCNKNTSDIDMFVCTFREPSMSQVKGFRNFYLAAHKKYGLKPDLDFPGELMTIDLLDRMIQGIMNWCPDDRKPYIQSYGEFEAIFFTAVLAEIKIGLIQRTFEFNNLELVCRGIVQKWKKEIGCTNTFEEHTLYELFMQKGFRFVETKRPKE